MKNLVTALVVLFYGATVGMAQDVTFHDMKWEKAKVKAQKENKFIFAYIGRGNSKQIQKVSDEVFSQKKVADYYNKHFVNIRVDMSNKETSKLIAPKLQMLMYPAVVFFSTDAEEKQLGNASPHSLNVDKALELAKKAVARGKEFAANNRSIKFKKKPRWQQMLAEAKKKDKLLFIDVYTEWCRPCIQMDRTVFTLNKVADFYNENFINIKYDAEKGEGKTVAEKYDVHGYPAYLFINGDGEVVHQFGGYTEADPFVAGGEKALQKFK